MNKRSQLRYAKNTISLQCKCQWGEWLDLEQLADSIGRQQRLYLQQQSIAPLAQMFAIPFVKQRCVIAVNQVALQMSLPVNTPVSITPGKLLNLHPRAYTMKYVIEFMLFCTRQRTMQHSVRAL